MKWFLDTEFSERGYQHPIELISIGLVSETGLEYYAVSEEFDATNCSDWVKVNVLEKIKDQPRLPRTFIAAQIELMIQQTGSKPEFWAYFGDYDWVVFCQLFGRMIDLPKGWPQYCRDLKQVMDDKGLQRHHLPRLDEAEAHSAIVDARWVRSACEVVGVVAGKYVVRDREDGTYAYWDGRLHGWSHDVENARMTKPEAEALVEKLRGFGYLIEDVEILHVNETPSYD